MKEAGQLSDNIKNETWKPAYQTNLGLVLTDLGRFDQALKLFEEADSGHFELGYRHWQAVNKCAWGRALMLRQESGNLDKAIVLIQEAETLSRNVYYPENISMHKGDLGRVFYLLQDYEKAYNYVNEALSLERRINAVHDHRHLCNLIIAAALCHELGKKDQFWELLVKAQILSKEIGADEHYPVTKLAEDWLLLNKLFRLYCTENSIEIEEIKNTPPKSIADLGMSQTQSLRVLEATSKMLDNVGFEYPWNGLEEYLQERGIKTIRLFGYGSLINKKSASRTLPNSAESSFVQAISFGIVRLLDYEMPDVVRARSMYSTTPGNLGRGLFNARFTGSLCDKANGIYFEIGLDEIQKLRKREIGYDLRSVVCLPWDDIEGEIFPAFALGCSGRLWEGRMLSNRELLPHKDYYVLCKTGAKEVSQHFYECFLQTAFIADGYTRVFEWESSQSDHQ